jgi:hypothetical protein
VIPTCLHCHRRFPENDVVEAFPFARRVAYDPARVRYWVVCTRCGKWSLAPIEAEDRASTVEQLERWWRGTSAHYTAGGIGVGELTPKVSVVRIGEARWDEFAAWRYADVLTRRRRSLYGAWAQAGLGIAGLGGWIAISGFTVLPITAAMLLMLNGWREIWRGNRKGICRVPTLHGERSLIRQEHLLSMELVRVSPTSWSVNVVHDEGVSTLSGPEGVRALGYGLPGVNLSGASSRDLRYALAVVTEAGGPEAIVERAAQPLNQGLRGAQSVLLYRYPTPILLALEMCTQEQVERRALENELALLRSEWQEAEEIAGIAETLPTA